MTVFLLTKLVAYEALWGGCAALYFSSPHQRSTASPMSKPVSLTLFIGAILLSGVLLSTQLNVWATCFAIITIVMMNFVLVTLASAHEKSRLMVITYGAVLAFFLAFVVGLVGAVGGYYVA